MKLKSRRKYRDFKEQNRHIREITSLVSVAETWAKMMEERMEKGIDFNPKVVFNMIEDSLNVTFDPFQRAYCVSILERFWEHGRLIRRWYQSQKDFSSAKIIIKI